MDETCPFIRILPNCHSSHPRPHYGGLLPHFAPHIHTLSDHNVPPNGTLRPHFYYSVRIWIHLGQPPPLWAPRSTNQFRCRTRTRPPTPHKPLLFPKSAPSRRPFFVLNLPFTSRRSPLFDLSSVPTCFEATIRQSAHKSIFLLSFTGMRMR